MKIGGIGSSGVSGKDIGHISDKIDNEFKKLSIWKKKCNGYENLLRGIYNGTTHLMNILDMDFNDNYKNDEQTIYYYERIIPMIRKVIKEITHNDLFNHSHQSHEGKKKFYH